MYLGNKTDYYLSPTSDEAWTSTDKASCFLYNAVFCIRRLALVLCLLFLRDMHGLYILYGFLFIQTWYVVYIAASMPHVDDWFNVLELANEILIILIIYTLMGYIETSILSAGA